MQLVDECIDFLVEKNGQYDINILQYYVLAGQISSMTYPENSMKYLTPANTNTAPGIPIGDYYVTVIDERGCFADNYINIDSVTNSFNTDSVDYISQNVSCFNGTNGAINITTNEEGIFMDSPYEGEYMTMATMTTGSVAKDSLQRLQLRSRYILANMQLVFPDPVIKGDFDLVDNVNAKVHMH